MTRVADASLVAGVTAAAHSIVFQFTLTFRFPFDTVVEREPPARSPFYCRGYIGLLHARFQPNYLILWEISLIRARTSRSREQKEPAWLSFFVDLYPPWPRRQRGIKRQTRVADSQLNFCSTFARVYFRRLLVWLKQIKSVESRIPFWGCDNCYVSFVYNVILLIMISIDIIDGKLNEDF